ncbi:tRNA (adenosine(37)-N6)-dimethylallyltransferase MiaA [Psychromarinibacter halotolerans]|uniref:tRNA dimethylallyltransferase n=1 Tax=Psychromarinibacter halotolerans TaxID=1775175 RepID=A0ABV7GUC8_9RHOB|nr:tRNA (adenosine(37)-N6)-dimethylallyltransferase MiaA [Psychromarinibacter halotolerans]MDF0594866.1 tRNA (adenosine(37)-N6)-dimethylallyltransferase MiaA [Psychromarinibacter halotolerans]
MRDGWLSSLDAERPVLIAGPTASGKSALALEVVSRHGGVIVNADALQVFANWRVLTARPGPDEESVAPHLLYGHVAGDAEYSVGHWLRDLQPILNGDARPVIVGGTGLYFTALTSGLASIPPTPPEVRDRATSILRDEGLPALLADLDEASAARIDTRNPMRVQRAWEVLTTTGRGIAAWQDDTPPPLLPLANAQPVLLDADRDWLGERIDRRFDAMIADGALDEARANLDAGFRLTWPSAKAIGAPELIGYLKGDRCLKAAVADGKIATRQFAKRQRTWFRSKMSQWTTVVLP